MRQYCDDLSTRLSNVEKTKDIEKMAELLAWADWRFQWIHPFKDFNGRVGRILLTVILFKLRLPPVETASVEPKERVEYLKALRSADKGDLSALIQVWINRLLKASKEGNSEL
jgi:Fic family protein